MKKLLSLILALVLVFSVFTAFSVNSVQTAVFEEGDVLFVRIQSPAEWAENATLYANFTDYSRADNGDKSIVIADADQTKVKPVVGVESAGEKLYRYTVTAADAGAAVMRFWRGNSEKLWNSSKVLTAENLRTNGVNTVVVSDWDDTGDYETTYPESIAPELALSKTKGEIGDTFEITVNSSGPAADADLTYSIRINGELYDTDTYEFKPTENGVYAIVGSVTARRDGKIVAAGSCTASITVGSVKGVSAAKANTLYAHAAADGAQDTEAWVEWQLASDSDKYWFYLPSSAEEGNVELFNTFSTDAVIGDTTIPAGSAAVIDARAGETYTAGVNNHRYTVGFLFSGAEASLFVNNPETFGGEDLLSYLQYNKENYAAATGAFTTPDGVIENSEIKKIKGRGNTSWDADKKGFNVTFKSAATVAGMPKCKKFSLISNFQDAALARNRILYDMSDEVGVPYASDSRFIDFYVNGRYQGNYQMCQKIDVGKNTLIEDFAEDDYLDAETGGVKADFSFVCEIDSSPSADDFHFSLRNGTNLTMKAPEIASDDPNYTAVRDYIRTKYNLMFSALEYNREELPDLIDIPSLAKVYLINELGKNWDSGATSFYLTYMPDKNGNYKFFASPVWDYDNSLGNARGIERDLNNMRVTDYTEPSGWFSTVKGGYGGPNFLATAVRSSQVMQEVKRTWFEDFLPAIDKLNGTKDSSLSLYSADVYKDLLEESAEMNYRIWELDTNGTWTADHSAVTIFTAAYQKNAAGQVTGVTLTKENTPERFDQYTFSGQFDYMMAWLNSRTAWISAQYIDGYVPSEIPTEPEPETEAPTEQPIDRPDLDMTNVIAAWIFDAKGKTAGDKLTEYGNADDGYAATRGSGTMTLSVSGDKNRALEWSDPEYNKSGAEIVPLMAAGSKNQWGSPYIRFDISAKGYETLKLTMYLAASKKAPASWKLQYSADGTTFTDIPDATLTVSSDNRKLLTAYFDRTALPDSLNDTENLSLRLVPVSMTTVSGGNTADDPAGGEVALNYIVISGLPMGDFEMGDIDLNGVVEILDVTALQRHLAHLTTLSEKQLALADVDHNGYPDITDGTRIQRYLAKLENEVEVKQ